MKEHVANEPMISIREVVNSHCEECGSDATSTFYNDILPNQLPTMEWLDQLWNG